MSQLMTYLEFTTALGNKKTLCGEEWCAITSVFIASVIKTWKIIYYDYYYITSNLTMTLTPVENQTIGLQIKTS